MKNYSNPYEAPKLSRDGEKYEELIKHYLQDEKFLGLIATDDGWYDSTGKKIGGLDDEDLKTKIDAALTEAKESGEFDGEDGKPYTYVLEVDEEGNLYCEYADIENAPNFEYDETLGDLYYITENSTKIFIGNIKGKDGDDYILTEEDVQEIVERVLEELDAPTENYSISLMSTDDSQKLDVISSTTGANLFSIKVTKQDGQTNITFSDSDETATISIKDGQDYILTEDDKDEIAELTKEKIPLFDYVKTVNGSIPDANGNVSISATINPPEFVENIEDMTDTAKQYVLDGYLYAYMQVTTPAHDEPNFTNYFDIDNVLLNQYTRRLDTVTLDNWAELGATNPNGFIQMVNSIPFTPEMLQYEHIIRVAHLGYGVRARPNYIQPWAGDSHATSVDGAPIGDLSSVDDSDVNGVQSITVPLGVDIANGKDWRNLNSINGTTGSVTGIKLNLKSQSGSPVTIQALKEKNIIITFDEEITYTHIPEVTEYKWVNTEQKYGDDYSTEIEALTNRVETLENAEDKFNVAISNPFIKSVNHRGYNDAPDNTLPAYKLSKKVGFDYVECDIQFTSDDVPILYHDSKINDTNINSMTYEEVKALRLFSGEYVNTEIPSFEEFISLCRNLGLHPYIELKTSGISTDNANTLYGLCKKYNMHKNCTWISFYDNSLGAIKAIDATARLGYIPTLSTISEETAKNNALALKTSENEVFLNAQSTQVTDNLVDLCIANNLPLEVWTVNSLSDAQGLNPYISGFTSDYIVIGTELLKAELS